MRLCDELQLYDMRGELGRRRLGETLVDWALRHGKRMRLRLERDDSKGLLILSDVLAEDVPEGLGLLRADVDALSVLDGDLILRFLVNKAESEKKILYADAYLNTVGVVLAIVLRLDHLNFWLWMAGIHTASRVQ